MSDFDQISNIRFSIFTPSKITESKEDLFEMFFGSMPEDSRLYNKELDMGKDGFLNSRKNSTTVEAMMYYEHGQKYDFLYSPIASVAPESFPVIGNAQQLIDDGFEGFERLLKFLPENIARVAVAVTAIKAQPGKTEAYELFSQKFPSLEIDVENDEEFSFKINKRKKSEYNGQPLVYNLLVGYMAAKVQVNVAKENEIVDSHVFYASTRELDCNTGYMTDLRTGSEENLLVVASEIRNLINSF